MNPHNRGGRVRDADSPVTTPAATLAATLAAMLLAVLPSVAAAAAPAWLTDVRDAAYARARAPLEGEILDAALRERRRAAAGALPALRLSERSHLGLDGAYGFTLDAGVAIPLLAPTVPADARVTTLRLAITRRQLAAQRRAEVHDALAQAAALLATRARKRALDGLARSLATRGPPSGAGGRQAGRDENPDPFRAHTSTSLTGGRTRASVDARLLLAGREAQGREARRSRAELARSLSLTLPAVDRLPAPQPAARGPLLGALGFTAAELQPRRCQIASDAVVLAHLSAAEQRASRRLREARAAPRVDLELGGAVDLGGAEPVARYTLRVAASVRLPPWSPASGAASLSAGVSGLEQETTLTWPNRTPGPPPTAAPSPDPIAEAERAVRAQLARLQGQEDDLARRRAVLRAALASFGGRTPDGAYLRATLALQLADTEQALDLTALDAAMLCSALPP